MPKFYAISKNSYYPEAVMCETETAAEAADIYREEADCSSGDEILIFSEKDAKEFIVEIKVSIN